MGYRVRYIKPVVDLSDFSRSHLLSRYAGRRLNNLGYYRTIRYGRDGVEDLPIENPDAAQEFPQQDGREE